MDERHVPLHSEASLNKAAERRLVTVYFSNNRNGRYSGKCKLRSLEKADAKTYESDPISSGADGVWGARFPDETIRIGEYILEVPLKKSDGTSGKMKQRIAIDHAYADVTEIKDGEVHYTDGVESILHEPLIGDGVSLEEAFLGLFNYKYVDGVGALLKFATPAGEGGGDETKKSGFATFIGVTKLTHDRIEAALGLLNPENAYFKNFILIKQVTRKSHSWKDIKTNVKSISGEKGEKIVERTLHRWGLRRWGTKVEGWAKPVEVVGKILETYEYASQTLEAYAAFNEASDAEIDFSQAAGRCYRERGDETGFSRGELRELEGGRQKADNLAGAAAVSGIGFTATMTTLFLGMAFPEGIVAEVGGEGAASFLNVAGKVKGALEKFASLFEESTDGLHYSSYVSNRYGELKEWWHDLGAVSHLNSSIFNQLIARQSGWDLHGYTLTFLYRAKVLYGLMRLIDACGSYEHSTETGRDEFENKVKSLRISEYIEKFVLGPPFWVRNDHLTVDWVEHFHLLDPQTQRAERDEIVRWEVPLDDGSKMDGSTRHGWNQWGEHGWTMIDFQPYFPIHFMDHKDAADFAKTFSLNYKGVSNSQVATSFWQVAASVRQTEAKTAQGEVSVNIEVDQWRTLYHGDTIDSEMPVRAILVFKDEHVRTGTPVTMQLRRVDWVNANGPTYKTFVRRFNKRDKLPGSIIDAKSQRPIAHLNRLKGAIVNFEYNFTWKGKEPSKVYRGLKPMTGWCHRATIQSMRMAVWWTAGKNEAQGWLANGEEVVVVPFNAEHHVGTYDPDFDQRNNAKFEDADFLKRDTTSEKFDVDVDKNDVTAVIRVGDGNGGWCAVPEHKTITYQQPVQVILKVKKRPHYPAGIPSSVQLVRLEGILYTNTPGPVYHSEKMVALDPFGFPGEWGSVFELYFYFIDGASMAVSKIPGVKPICRGSVSRSMEISYADYSFQLRYRVGDSWGRKTLDWTTAVAAEPSELKFDITPGQELSYKNIDEVRVSYVLSGDGSTRKAVLANVRRESRDRVIEELCKKHAIDPDILTEANL